MLRQILIWTAVWLMAWAIAAGPLRAQATFELGEEGFEKVEAPDPSTPEGELHTIRRAIAGDRAEDAVKLADRWIERHRNHRLLPQAFLLRGDAKVSREQFYDALFDYELILRQFPGSDVFHTALERELKIAEAFGRGVKRRFLGLRLLTAYSEAEEILIRIQERAPGSEIAERAGIQLADLYYRRSNMDLAAEAYDLFLQNYPDSQWREHAMQRQIMANLATFKGPKFDATSLIEAENRLEDYERVFPAAAQQIGADALLTRIDETLATRSLLVGQWYERQGNEVSAAFTYRRLIEEHPGSTAAQQALDRLRVLDPQMFAPPPPEAAAPPPAPEVETTPAPTPETQPEAAPPANADQNPLATPAANEPAPAQP